MPLSKTVQRLVHLDYTYLGKSILSSQLMLYPKAEDYFSIKMSEIQMHLYKENIYAIKTFEDFHSKTDGFLLSYGFNMLCMTDNVSLE